MGEEKKMDSLLKMDSENRKVHNSISQNIANRYLLTYIEISGKFLSQVL
jgi:hypothetical protein